MMKSLPPPLLLRAELLPGESLSSYLTRVAHRNAMPTAHNVLELLTDLAEPHSPEWYASLSSLTGCTSERLKAASRHSLAPLLEGFDYGPVRDS